MQTRQGAESGAERFEVDRRSDNTMTVINFEKQTNEFKSLAKKRTKEENQKNQKAISSDRTVTIGAHAAFGVDPDRARIEACLHRRVAKRTLLNKLSRQLFERARKSETCNLAICLQAGYSFESRVLMKHWILRENSVCVYSKRRPLDSG